MLNEWSPLPIFDCSRSARYLLAVTFIFLLLVVIPISLCFPGVSGENIQPSRVFFVNLSIEYLILSVIFFFRKCHKL